MGRGEQSLSSGTRCENKETQSGPFESRYSREHHGSDVGQSVGGPDGYSRSIDREDVVIVKSYEGRI